MHNDSRKPYKISAITLGIQIDRSDYAENRQIWGFRCLKASLPPHKPRNENEASFWNSLEISNARKPNKIISITLRDQIYSLENAENSTKPGFYAPKISQLFCIFRDVYLDTQDNSINFIWFCGIIMDFSEKFGYLDTYPGWYFHHFSVSGILMSISEGYFQKWA